MLFATNNTERMRIDSAGNVGIGTVSPSLPLEVNGVIESNAATNGVRVKRGSSGYYGEISVDYVSSKVETYIDSIAGPSFSGEHVFRSSSGGGAVTERMRINASGNVGIGTSSPFNNARLQVKTGTDLNFAVQTGTTLANGIKINAFNDAANANIPLEINGSALLLKTNETERMRIDSSGNVGIGTTPSGWGAAFDVIDVGPYGSFSADNDTTFITNNAYYNGSNWIYKNSNLAGRYRQQQGFHVWDTAASGTAGGTLTFSERMRIDASGNVGIGNTNPSYKLEVSGAGTVLARLSATDSAQAYMAFTNSTTGGGIFADGTIVGLDSDESAVFYNFEATPMRFGTSGIERMRIDSSGNLLVGTTSLVANERLSVKKATNAGVGIAYFENTNNGNGDQGIRSVLGANADNTTSYHYVGRTGTNDRIYIFGNGSIVNTYNFYGALSDERLKSNIVDASSQIDDIMAVQVRSYTLDSTGDTHIGVVAQELEASGMSGLVQENEEGIKSVKYSVLYMKAIKALQEAVTRIETLEAEVAALKGA
jgi:hypothetical protein